MMRSEQKETAWFELQDAAVPQLTTLYNFDEQKASQNPQHVKHWKYTPMTEKCKLYRR